MLQLQQVKTPLTGPLPSLSPVDFVDVAYHAGFLLPVSFDRSLTDVPAYSEGCEYGFEDYFEVMYTGGRVASDGVTLIDYTFIPRYYTRQEVAAFVLKALTEDASKERSSFAWYVGFVLGWLSALALTDDDLSRFGLQVLTHLVRLQQSTLYQ